MQKRILSLVVVLCLVFLGLQVRSVLRAKENREQFLFSLSDRLVNMVQVVENVKNAPDQQSLELHVQMLENECYQLNGMVSTYSSMVRYGRWPSFVNLSDYVARLCLYGADREDEVRRDDIIAGLEVVKADLLELIRQLSVDQELHHDQYGWVIKNPDYHLQNGPVIRLLCDFTDSYLWANRQPDR